MMDTSNGHSHELVAEFDKYYATQDGREIIRIVVAAMAEVKIGDILKYSGHFSGLTADDVRHRAMDQPDWFVQHIFDDSDQQKVVRVCKARIASPRLDSIYTKHCIEAVIDITYSLYKDIYDKCGQEWNAAVEHIAMLAEEFVNKNMPETYKGEDTYFDRIDEFVDKKKEEIKYGKPRFAIGDTAYVLYLDMFKVEVVAVEHCYGAWTYRVRGGDVDESIIFDDKSIFKTKEEVKKYINNA